LISKFSVCSPTDSRYTVKELIPYLSAEAYVKYKARVERALVETLAKRGICSADVAEEIAAATDSVTAKEVNEEEKRVKHDIRALVNVIQLKVSDQAKPYVHLAATSYDIVDTANSLRYKEAVEAVIIPDMTKLEKVWIELARRWKDDAQIGRTHGQFAVPITFGFAVAQYVNRWGDRIMKLRDSALRLVGKFSGAVGAYNASSLLIADPDRFEQELLSSLGLRPAPASTQIVPPEPMTDLIHSVVSAWGVLANFSRDMRNLQRSEIGEVGEPFGEEQVGSSTMPQKRNPENFENVESLWKEFLPRMTTKYLDQVSEHQRDLTNSASQRYDAEFFMTFDSCVRRILSISQRLLVDQANMKKNLETALPTIVAEPLYILLASLGHSNAHEYVRKLTLEAPRKGKSIVDLALSDPSLQPLIKKLSPKHMELLRDPSKYIGLASSVTDKVLNSWERKLREEHLW